MSLSTAVEAQFKLILRHNCKAGPAWNGGCLFHLSIAIFGYSLIFIVAAAQIPLLYKILKYKQHNDLLSTPMGVGLLALMASNNVAYAVNKHLPISTWGDSIVQLAQYLIIINLRFIHQGRHRQAVTFTLLYVTLMVGSLTPVVPAKVVTYLKLINLPIDIIRQMFLIYQCLQKGFPIGPVASRKSIALLNLCSIGRLLTAYVHTNDTILITAYGQESVGNVALSIVALILRRRNLKTSEATKIDVSKEKRVRNTSCEENCVNNNDSGFSYCSYVSSSGSNSNSGSCSSGSDDCIDVADEEKNKQTKWWKRCFRKLMPNKMSGVFKSGHYRNYCNTGVQNDGGRKMTQGQKSGSKKELCCCKGCMNCSGELSSEGEEYKDYVEMRRKRRRLRSRRFATESFMSKLLILQKEKDPGFSSGSGLEDSINLDERGDQIPVT